MTACLYVEGVARGTTCLWVLCREEIKEWTPQIIWYREERNLHDKLFGILGVLHLSRINVGSYRIYRWDPTFTPGVMNNFIGQDITHYSLVWQPKSREGWFQSMVMYMFGPKIGRVVHFIVLWQEIIQFTYFMVNYSISNEIPNV